MHAVIVLAHKSHTNLHDYDARAALECRPEDIPELVTRAVCDVTPF